MKVPEKNALGFIPSWNTCFAPRLYYENKCDECGFRVHVNCEKNDNYKKYIKQYKDEEITENTDL